VPPEGEEEESPKKGKKDKKKKNPNEPKKGTYIYTNVTSITSVYTSPIVTIACKLPLFSSFPNLH
jgi:hypothetical protein